VRYEDLLDDAAQELAGLCAFIDLPYSGSMLDYQGREQQRALGRDPEHHLWKPPTKGLRDWRSQMSRADILLFESIAGASLDAFNYERSGIAPTRGDRVGLWAGARAAGTRTRAERLKVAAASRLRRSGRSQRLGHA
jgi:hypothetical protein